MMHYSVASATFYYATLPIHITSVWCHNWKKKQALDALQHEKGEGNRSLILFTDAPTQAVTVSSTKSLAPTKAATSILTLAPTSSPSPHFVFVDTNSIGDSPSPVPSTASIAWKSSVPRAPTTTERPRVPSAASITEKPLYQSSPGTTRVPSASPTTKKPAHLETDTTAPIASEKSMVPSSAASSRSPMVTPTSIPSYGNTNTPSPSLRKPDNSAGAQIQQVLTSFLCLIPLAWFLLY